MLLIGIDTIKVVMKDGRVCTLLFENSELRDLIQWQVSVCMGILGFQE